MVRPHTLKARFSLLVLGWTMATCLGFAQSPPVLPSAPSPYGNPGQPLYTAMDRTFKALAQQDYDAAIQNLQQAAQIAPARPDIHKQLGYAYIRTGQTGLAIGEFERVRQLDPKDQATLLQLGYLYQGAKRDKEAAEVFQRAAQGPDAQTAKTARAALNFLGNRSLYEPMDKAYKALAVKDYDAAITDLQEAARIAPARTDIHKQLAYAYIRTGQTEPAIREFERVHELDPRDSMALLQLGYLYDRAMRDEEAAAIFVRLSSGPDPQSAKMARVALAALGDKYKEEISRLQSNLSSDPNNLEARKELGLILERIRRPQEAFEQLSIAAKGLPADPQVSFALAEVCVMTKSTELALWYFYNASRGNDPAIAAQARKAFGTTDLRDLLAKLVIAYPFDARIRREYGFLLLNANDTAGAGGQFEAAVKADPLDWSSFMQLGYLYDRAGKRDRARSVFQTVASSQDPVYSKQAGEALRAWGGASPPEGGRAQPAASPAATDPRALAYALHQQGKVTEAIRVFEQLHASAPNDCSVTLQLGYWCFDQKDLPKAKRWFESAEACPDPGQSAVARKAVVEVTRAQSAQFKAAGFHRKDSGDIHGAIAEFERAVAIDPADYNAMLQLGYWYFDAHDYKQAEKWFQMAASSPHPAEVAIARKAL
ncbi:MAG TPA: tetratricopeptide repeat protein, partial [Terriglobia bacterium]|nr:tetratricopeptide repeat protein [Terriglobia bacterium]